MKFARYLPLALILAACAAESDSVQGMDTAPAADTMAMEDSAAPRPTTPEPSANSQALTPNGWGPLTIGMTREQVVQAVGDKDPDVVGGPEPEMCEEWQPVSQPGLLLMLENGALARISLIRESTLESDRGVGLGDTAESVKTLYGDEAEATPHKYSPAPAEYITFWQTAPPADNPRGIVYEIGPEGTVTHIHAGGPAIQYVEGCL